MTVFYLKRFYSPRKRNFRLVKNAQSRPHTKTKCIFKLCFAFHPCDFLVNDTKSRRPKPRNYFFFFFLESTVFRFFCGSQSVTPCRKILTKKEVEERSHLPLGVCSIRLFSSVKFFHSTTYELKSFYNEFILLLLQRRSGNLSHPPSVLWNCKLKLLWLS